LEIILNFEFFKRAKNSFSLKTLFVLRHYLEVAITLLLHSQLDWESILQSFQLEARLKKPEKAKTVFQFVKCRFNGFPIELGMRYSSNSFVLISTKKLL